MQVFVTQNCTQILIDEDWDFLRSLGLGDDNSITFLEALEWWGGLKNLPDAQANTTKVQAALGAQCAARNVKRHTWSLDSEMQSRFHNVKDIPKAIAGLRVTLVQLRVLRPCTSLLSSVVDLGWSY